MEDLGMRLALVRRKRERTQRDVAAQIGISQKHLSQVEHGRFPLLHLRCHVVIKLAQELDVPVLFLLGLTDEGGIEILQAAAMGYVEAETMADEPVYPGTEHTGGSIPCREI